MNKEDNLLSRIETNPQVLTGKPTVRGLRPYFLCDGSHGKVGIICGPEDGEKIPSQIILRMHNEIRKPGCKAQVNKRCVMRRF